MVDCPRCGHTFEGFWAADLIDPEQMDEAPVSELTCPECEHVAQFTYPGWSYTTEAGL